ncbi:uncharacterized protein BDCG_17290 [Blastomyces dermatitidis ER-3]|uniref:Ankyrin repeat protein n=1 Tax=Ajellomyces dermatitidis (strain ER-3 / ATCC MYA-2586) TaxID=559297 RepID=A0ABX2VXP6_AJEDR|nr:uncharacterized protein BDCG_17290 [Blastomyces dermatitidis ER-3]OAT01920.1 hypothetical protein BDCG_17290 [Blastomyces dermatitidis ER-3]
MILSNGFKVSKDVKTLQFVNSFFNFTDIEKTLSVVRKNVRPSDNNAAASELLAYAYECKGAIAAANLISSFTDTIIIINKNRENQILGLQQKIEHLHRQVTMLNLKILLQSFMISSEVYTSLKITAQDENSSMKYIKSEDLSESLSFNDD